jgi:hypothetical protein
VKRNPGEAYQDIVASIVRVFDPEAQVNAGEWIDGPDGRLDMDVSVRGTMDGKPTLTVIECKDFDLLRTGKVGRPFVDALDSKRTDLKADFALFCSNSGFTSDALSKAKRVGIGMISILSMNDKRVKVCIEEEVYFRKVWVDYTKFEFEMQQLKVQSDGKDIKYEGLQVIAWLFNKANFIARHTQRTGRITATFRFPSITFFAMKGKPTIVKSISVTFNVRAEWYSQTVKLDAPLAIYDYLRGRLLLPGGTHQFLVNGLNFSKGKRVNFVPAIEQRGLGFGPGEIDPVLITTWLPKDKAPNLDPLILPIDLNLKQYL